MTKVSLQEKAWNIENGEDRSFLCQSVCLMRKVKKRFPQRVTLQEPLLLFVKSICQKTNLNRNQLSAVWSNWKTALCVWQKAAMDFTPSPCPAR